MRDTNVPFSFLVGNMHTYKTIVQVKAENLEQFKDIITILGAFHHQVLHL